MKRICYYFARGGITTIKLTFALIGLDSIALVTLNFFKWANPGLFFVYFCLFHMTQFKYKLIKASMVFLGLELEVAG